MDPKKELLSGVKIMERILVPAGFAFELETEGQGSGGKSCSGAFVRGDRAMRKDTVDVAERFESAYG